VGIRQKMRPRWMLLPVMMGIFFLQGCSAQGLLNRGSSTSPAEATVTAIVKTATATTVCGSDKIGTSAPTLSATMVSTTTNSSVTIGTFRATQITLVGTCWLPDHTVTIAAIARDANGNRTVIALTTATAPAEVNAPTPVANNQPLRTAIKADGTFTTTFVLSADLAPYAVDNRLTLLAYADGYMQVAATSIQVS
jgi:hypothetical protein